MDPNSKHQPTAPKLRRAPKLAHAVSALALGVGFAALDRLSGAGVDFFFPREHFVEMLVGFNEHSKKQHKKPNNVGSQDAMVKTESIVSKQEGKVKFKRDELIKKVQKPAANGDSEQHKVLLEEKKALIAELDYRRAVELQERLLMNFFYGVTFAKLGSEFNHKVLPKKATKCSTRNPSADCDTIFNYFLLCIRSSV